MKRSTGHIVMYLFCGVLLTAVPLHAATISVNFHVGGDADAQADHELTGSEAAGLDNNTTWNNINVGSAGVHNKAGIFFRPAALTDDTGHANAAALALSSGSTWYVGYPANAAKYKEELGLDGHHDDLFNSYLALGMEDSAALQISGLADVYTRHGYHVIIYSDSDRRPGSKAAESDRQSLFTLTPAGGSALTASIEDDSGADRKNTFSGSYIASDNVEDGADYSNYTVFSNLTASSFTLELSSPDGVRGAISGFQIVAAQEGTTLGLITY